MADISTHIRRGHPIAFITFSIVSFIIAVIASSLTTSYNKHHNFYTHAIENSTRFLVFAGWWGVLVGIVYTALFLTSRGGVITSIAGHAVILFLTWIFFLSGAAALSSQLDFDCRHVDMHHCHASKAMMAFSWINWIILTLMLVVVGFVGTGAFRGGKSVKEGLA